MLLVLHWNFIEIFAVRKLSPEVTIQRSLVGDGFNRFHATREFGGQMVAMLYRA